MCGEKYINGKKWEEIAGSPPRVRGKEGNLKMKTTEQRITPACAGKRQSTNMKTPPFEDHPRVCGEKCPAQPLPLPALGSPPRVRGKGNLSSLYNQSSRITPACAGKSDGTGKRFIPSEDHPRVCGEKPTFTIG